MFSPVPRTPTSSPVVGHLDLHANEPQDVRQPPRSPGPGPAHRTPPQEAGQRPRGTAPQLGQKAEIEDAEASSAPQDEAGAVAPATLEKPTSPLLERTKDLRARTQAAGRRGTPKASPRRDASPALPEAERVAQAHPAVRDMVAKLNTAITSARDHPQRERVASVLMKFLSTTDSVRALTTGADHEIRHDPDVRQALQGAREVLDHMRHVLQSYKDGLPAKTRRQLEATFKEADRYLRNFSEDSTVTFRVSTLALIRALNTAVFVGVPAVEKQKKTLALYNASASKSVIRSIGLARRPTTHGPQVLDHFLQRGLISTQESILFGLGLIPRLMKEGRAKQRLHAATHSPGYFSAVAVGSVITAGIAYHGREIKGLLNKLVHGEWQPELKGDKIGTFGEVAVQRALELGRSLATGDIRGAWDTVARQRWHREFSNLEMPPNTRQALEHLLDVSGLASQGVGHLRSEMEGKIGQLSDSSNWTIGNAEHSFDRIHEALAAVLGESRPVQRPNTDLPGKVLLVALAAAVLVAPMYFLKDNPIGFVDLVANAAFVVMIMGMIAGNSSKNAREAEDNFGSFCGFSLAMTPVWAINMALGDKMEKSWAAMGVGSVVLGLIGNLLTVPIGKAASAAAGWAVTKLGRAEAEPPPGAGLHDGREPRIRELPEAYDAAAAVRRHAPGTAEP
jgi:hypothetical protein